MYKLIDSGDGCKLESFGPIVLSRPSPQAVWPKRAPKSVWEGAHALFSRDEGSGWRVLRPMKEPWQITVDGLHFLLKRTEFGHIGFFPEHRLLWDFVQERVERGNSLLNLFAYSGAIGFAAARQGALVTHLDASPKIVAWAKENAALNGINDVRYIVDDASKFVNREVRREKRYDAIILDPPSFGRGSGGEVFKIEDDLFPLLTSCEGLLSDQARFVLLTSHTPGYTPLVLKQLLYAVFERRGGRVESGELVLQGETFDLPSGSFAKWTP